MWCLTSRRRRWTNLNFKKNIIICGAPLHIHITIPGLEMALLASCCAIEPAHIHDNAVMTNKRKRKSVLERTLTAASHEMDTNPLGIATSLLEIGIMGLTVYVLMGDDASKCSLLFKFLSMMAALYAYGMFSDFLVFAFGCKGGIQYVAFTIVHMSQRFTWLFGIYALLSESCTEPKVRNTAIALVAVFAIEHAPKPSPPPLSAADRRSALLARVAARGLEGPG